MTIGINKRGRPYFVADIPFENDTKMQLLDEFYRVCSKFDYRDMVALSRTLSVSDRTIRRWKYKETFPRWDIAVDVIDWYKRGKPMNLVQQKDKITTMF